MPNSIKLPDWLQVIVDKTKTDSERRAWPNGELPRVAFKAIKQAGEYERDAQASLLQCVIAEVERLRADAARYAFIRAHHTQTHSLHMDGTSGWRFHSINGRASTFDKLIDGKIEEAADWKRESEAAEAGGDDATSF